MKVNMQSVNFSADQKLFDYIDQKLSKVDKFFGNIVRADVILKLENSGQVRDKIVELKLVVPGNVLLTKDSGKTFEAAFDSSVKSLKRRIIKYKERLKSKSKVRASN
jgi:putative sigma-54 modulation protein